MENAEIATVKLAEYVLSCIQASRVLLVLEDPCAPETATSLLANDEVAGLVVPEPIPGLSDDRRIGIRPGRGSSEWVLPDVPSDHVAVLGRRGELGIRALLPFARRQFWRVWFADRSTGRVSTWPLPMVVLKRVGLGAVVRHPIFARTMRMGLNGIMIGSFLTRLLPSQNRKTGPGDPRTVQLVIGSLGAGGSERQLVYTAIALKDRYHLKPIVTCLDLRGEANAFHRQTLDRAGIECIDLSAIAARRRAVAHLSSIGAIVPSDFVSQLDAMMSVMEEHRPAIVHSFLDTTNVLAATAAALVGVPNTVLGTRSMAPDNFWPNTAHLRFGYKLILRLTSAVVCNNSRAGAADYRRWLSLPRLKIVVFPNGIDFSTFVPRSGRRPELKRAAGIPADAIVVGGVLRFTEEKRPDLWARAAIEMSRRRPDIHFLLAGDGPLRERVIEIFKRARNRGTRPSSRTYPRRCLRVRHDGPVPAHLTAGGIA